MSDDIPFDKTPPAPAEMAQLAPLVRRFVAPNAGPFTFTGTCAYVVGAGRVAVIDPGPDDPAHVEALVAALGDERVEAILVTHTHHDHSPGARLLQQATGAPILGCAPHVAAPDAPAGTLDARHDQAHRPDAILLDDEIFSGDGYALQALATPGHASNHLAFALVGEKALFSGDHVMAWSTTIVAPPDGNMRDYMASLDKLRARDDRVFWPGHGGPVREPQRYMRALAAHRRLREAAILTRLEAGDRDIPTIVQAIYEKLDPRLARAAGMSVLAHLEDLVTRGLAISDQGVARLDAHYARP